MAHTGSGRRHCDVVTKDGAASSDYREIFEVETGNAEARSPEQWARTVFEDGPLPVRWLLLLSWPAVLGLRLGPRSSSEHVLGWRIAATESDAIRLEAQSVLMTAELVLHVADSTAALITSVSYTRWVARPLWAVVLPIHRQIAPYLLRRAATRSQPTANLSSRPMPVGRSDVPSPDRGMERRPFVIWFQRRIANPLFRRLARFLPGLSVIETVGRRSGLARRTPVGGRLEGSTFWLVSEFGRQSNYVRNIEANPHVRVQIRGRWRTGRATILDDDPPHERLSRLPRLNSFAVRLVGTDLLTLRVDLDPPC